MTKSSYNTENSAGKRITKKLIYKKFNNVSAAVLDTKIRYRLLISGPQGSGKSELLRSLMKDFENPVLLSFEQFTIESIIHLQKKHDCIAIDGVYCELEFKYLKDMHMQSLIHTNLIVTTQRNVLNLFPEDKNIDMRYLKPTFTRFLQLSL
jgi:ABC-type ATPase involved in cell division